MAVAKWAAPGTEVDIHGTELNSLANGSTSARMAYDNSSALNLYARITVELGTITPAAGGSITLVPIMRRSTNDEDVASAADRYTLPLAAGAATKRVIFPMVRLYPFVMGFVVTNNAGVGLNATGNEVTLIPFNEDVS
jgi:hypothetical protein